MRLIKIEKTTSVYTFPTKSIPAVILTFKKMFGGTKIKKGFPTGRLVYFVDELGKEFSDELCYQITNFIRSKQ